MIYTGITPEWFAAIEQNAVAKTGMAISGKEGTVTGKTPVGNITIQWMYDQEGQTLTVGATHKPFFLLESEIDKNLTSLIESSKP